MTVTIFSSLPSSSSTHAGYKAFYIYAACSSESHGLVSLDSLTHAPAYHRSLGRLVIRCRDSVVDRITQSIPCCLSSANTMLMEVISSTDAALMEALELLVRGSIGCRLTTLLDAVSSVSGESIDRDWRHCGLHVPMSRGVLSSLTGMGSIVMDSMRMAYKMHISGDQQHTSSSFTSHKEDDDCVSSDIVAYEDGEDYKHGGCIQSKASPVDPTSPQREEQGLLGLLLKSNLFQDVHSNIHYSLAMTPINNNERLSTTTGDFFMIHFCARRIAILLTCLIAHRFNAPVQSYRWLVGILHCSILSQHHRITHSKLQFCMHHV